MLTSIQWAAVLQVIENICIGYHLAGNEVTYLYIIKPFIIQRFIAGIGNTPIDCDS